MPTATTVSVTVPYDAPDSLVGEIRTDTGLDPVLYRPRAIQDVPGYVVIVAVLGPVATVVAQKAGEDLHDGLRRLAVRLWRREPAKVRGVRLTDRSTGVTFEIDDSALADGRAWRELGRTDRAALRRGTRLKWDARNHRWQSTRP